MIPSRYHCGARNSKPVAAEALQSGKQISLAGQRKKQ